MEGGNLNEDMFERITVALEKSAFAQEELIRLATEERNAGDNMVAPPFCPHCGHLDPRIRNEGGTGQFGEFLLVGGCMECGKSFIAVANGWSIYKDQDELREGRVGQ